MAQRIINPKFPAAGVMVSVNSLRKRKSDFRIGDWLLDSGAFTEIAKHGSYRYSIEEYHRQICRWAECGNLLAAVAQDWMCEAFVIERTGLSVAEHQRLTIDRYDRLLALNPPVPILPVLQGFYPYQYLEHLKDYGDRLAPGQWVGIGSVCRRNGNPQEILNIIGSLHAVRPDLKFHGFGLKQLALDNPGIRRHLYSCDSMAWSYPLRFTPAPGDDCVQNPRQREERFAHLYQEKVARTLAGSRKKKVPRTAGAGNGQGRKPKWKSPTRAIRVPEKYAARLIAVAREWEEKE